MITFNFPTDDVSPTISTTAKFTFECLIRVRETESAEKGAQTDTQRPNSATKQIKGLNGAEIDNIE